VAIIEKFLALCEPSPLAPALTTTRNGRRASYRRSEAGCHAPLSAVGPFVSKLHARLDRILLLSRLDIWTPQRMSSAFILHVQFPWVCPVKWPLSPASASASHLLILPVRHGVVAAGLEGDELGARLDLTCNLIQVFLRDSSHGCSEAPSTAIGPPAGLPTGVTWHLLRAQQSIPNSKGDQPIS
jgi:hypothetical protein